MSVLTLLLLFVGALAEENVTKPENTTIGNSQKTSETQQVNITTKAGVYKDFRPSPQLETIYEFNHFPVVPAQPEAKTFASSAEKPDIWSTKIRFPSQTPVTVNDHPYPFMKGEEVTVAPYYGDSRKQPSYGTKYTPYADNWDKTLFKKPSKTFHEEDPYSYGSYGSYGHTDLSASPWKKIIKMLAAVIPIGLLISALTPSVIQISPGNTTATARGRSEELPTIPKILQKLEQGCDERIFCELLLSAEESRTSEKTVESLLDNYMQEKGDPAKLNRIYRAIKKGSCSALKCQSIPKT